MVLLSLLPICSSSEKKPFFLQGGRWKLDKGKWKLVKGWGNCRHHFTAETYPLTWERLVKWMTLPHGYHPAPQACWRASRVIFKHHVNHAELALWKRRKKGQQNIIFTSSSAFLLLKPFTEASFTGLDLILFVFLTWLWLLSGMYLCTPTLGWMLFTAED